MSYEHVWESASINGSNPKYSVSLIIPKSDTKTIAAIKDGAAKFGGKIPPKGALKLPLRDGDAEQDDEAYKGAYFVNANSTTAPQIVDRAVQPILDRSEVYSGSMPSTPTATRASPAAWAISRRSGTGSRSAVAPPPLMISPPIWTMTFCPEKARK